MEVKDNISEIIFGIISGAGAIFIAGTLALAALIIVSSLYPYFIIVFFVIYLLILILTSIFFARGLFRKVYLISTVIMFLVIYFLIKALLTPIYSI